MNEDVILLLVLPLVASSLLGLLARSMGLSIIAGYILGGVIVGPVFHLVDPASPILSFLGELGVILIAFEIGLTMKMDFLSRGGARAGGIVAVEMVIVSLVSFLLGSFLGLQWGDTLVLMFMAMNTSTAVTFKMMEERGVEDQSVKTLILGVGAFEDIVAIVGLSVFPVLAAIGAPSPLSIIQLVAGILVSVILMIYVGLRVLSRPLEWVANRESEIFVAVSLAVVLTYAYVGLLSGLSTALGAFVAGLVVSNLRVSEIISEKLHSLRDISTLIFFSSIGASLPVVRDPVLIGLALAVAILVVLVKFFGFSISSWVMGMRLEESYRLGLYMLAISEFGVILARNAVEEGFASENLYLVSVIALAGSALMSSGLIMFERTLPWRLAGLFPHVLRIRIEGFFGVLAGALGRERQVFSDIREAFWELMRRIAIMIMVATGANLTITYVTPLLHPAVRAYADLGVAVFSALVIVFVALGMRGVCRRLVKGIISEMGEGEKGLGDVFYGFLYALTLAFVGIAILVVSLPLIVRSLRLVLGELGSSLLVVLLILAILLLSGRAALGASRRLERTFKIE